LAKGRIAVLSPSRRRMHSSVACAGQAHSPAAVGEQCGMHSCIGTGRPRPILKWAGTCPLKSVPSPSDPDPHLIYYFLGFTRICFPNSISNSRSVPLQPFLHSSPVCPTHRRTTAVAIGSIYEMRAGDAS